MIIIEGLDATGKSTLAQHIVKYVGEPLLHIQESEGPPRYKGEMNDRIRRYNDHLTNVIFVRHPVVSNPIYDATRDPDRVDPIDPYLTRAFYATGHFFIYCDPGKFHAPHEVKPHDDPDHLKMIAHNRKQHLDLYRSWAVKKAHYIYRIGDDMDRIARICAGVVDEEASSHCHA